MTEGQSTEAELLAGIVGKPIPPARVVVERGPVAFFAEAVLSDDPVYTSPAAAAEAGFAGIPAPPTFAFVMDNWGQFEEIQPDPTVDRHSLATVLGPLMAKGGLILHGEEEFVYHRPVVVGDVLRGEGSIVDAYQKRSKGKTMTFVVTEMNWVDDQTGEPVVTTRFNVIHRM